MAYAASGTIPCRVVIICLHSERQSEPSQPHSCHRQSCRFVRANHVTWGYRNNVARRGALSQTQSYAWSSRALSHDHASTKHMTDTSYCVNITRRITTELRMWRIRYQPREHDRGSVAPNKTVATSGSQSSAAIFARRLFLILYIYT